MAIGKLLEKVSQETSERIAAIRAGAEKEVAEILRRAEEKLAEQRKQEINRIEQKVKEYEESLISPARLKANQMFLEVKQKLLADLLSKILAIWKEQPVKFKQKLYHHWLENYSGGELVVSNEEKNVWTTDFLKEINHGGKKFKLAAATDDFHFGFRLKEEKWEVDFSGKVLLESFREKAQIWVNREWLNG